MADTEKKLKVSLDGDASGLVKTLKTTQGETIRLAKAIDGVGVSIETAFEKRARAAAVSMDRLHGEALKLDGQFKSSSQRAGDFADSVGKASTKLAGAASSFGLPAGPLRALNDAMDVAELGFGNLSKSAAGFNAASFGVAGAGLAMGVAIGGMANKLEVVRTFFDNATRSLYDFLQARGLFESSRDSGAGATSGLAEFRAQAAASHAKAIRTQVEALKAQGLSVEEIAKQYRGLNPELLKSLGLTDRQIDAGKKASAAAKEALEAEKRSLEQLSQAMGKFFDELGRRREQRETFSLLGETVDDLSLKLGLMGSQLERLAKAGGELSNAGLGRAIRDMRDALAGGGSNAFGEAALGALEAEQQRRVAAAGTEQAIKDLGIAVLPVNEKFASIGRELLPLVTRETKTTTASTVEWDQQLENISHLIASFPGGLGKVGSALSGLTAGGAGIGAGLKAFKDAGALGGLQGILGKVGAAGQIASAAIGIGTAIAGLFKSDPVKKAQQRAGKALGHGISREMAEQFIKEAKETGKSIEQVAKDWQRRIKAEQDAANLETLRAGVDIAQQGAEGLLGLMEKLSPAAQAAGGALVKAVADAMAANGLGVLDPQLAKNEQFSAVQDAVGAAGQVFDGLRQAGGISTDLLANGGAFADALRQQAVEAALAEGKTQEEANKAGLAVIAPLLRDQLEASIQSGEKLSAQTQQLLDEAKANGIEIVADPMIALLGENQEQTALLRKIAGGAGAAAENGEFQGKFRAAAGLGPLFTGGGSPRLDLQLDPHEAAFVVPRADSMDEVTARLLGGSIASSGEGRGVLGSVTIAPNITINGSGLSEDRLRLVAVQAVADGVRLGAPQLTAAFDRRYSRP